MTLSIRQWTSCVVLFLGLTSIDAFTLLIPQHTICRSTPSNLKPPFSTLVPTPKKATFHNHNTQTTTTTTTTKLHQSSNDKDDKDDKDLSIEQILQPWKVDIPDEYRNQILEAEANTPAGKERKQRMNFYLSGTILGIVISSGNLYLTTLREYGNTASFAEDVAFLNEQGFDWVTSNPVLSFLLMNGIGGALGLLMFGGCGTMLELEQRTKSESVQKIWDELVRRKESKEGKEKIATKRMKQKKKNKKKKRLEALSEIIVQADDDTDEKKVSDAAVQKSDDTASAATTTTAAAAVEDEEKKETKKGGGIFDKAKELYARADSMAASQALLLNKKLEDEGVLEKITDESGLRVIGKEAASKLKEKEEKKED